MEIKDIDNITIDEALEILEKHQEWRLGAEFDMIPPKMISIAMQKAINVLHGLKKSYKMYQYKIVGKPETYSDFNQGWEGCADFINEYDERIG